MRPVHLFLQKGDCDSGAIEDTIRRHVPVASLVNDVSMASPCTRCARARVTGARALRPLPIELFVERCRSGVTCFQSRSLSLRLLLGLSLRALLGLEV